MPSRREVLLGGGALAATGAAGLGWWLTEDSEEPSGAEDRPEPSSPSEPEGDPEHHIQVLNRRDTAQEVTIEGSLDEEELSYGPRELAAGEDWDVDVIEREGWLELTFTVDGEVAWETIHEVPNPGGSRVSAAQLILAADGEFVRSIPVED